jgi:hypothetical protein
MAVCSCISCDYCGLEDHSNNGDLLSSEVRAEFARQGWEFRGEEDLCPECKVTN